MPKDFKTPEDLYSFPFKIERINADTIFVRRGLQREKCANIYGVKDWSRLSKKFDLSVEAFSGELEFYGVQNLQERKRLYRPIREGEEPRDYGKLNDEFEKSMQEKRLSVELIIRPRN